MKRRVTAVSGMMPAQPAGGFGTRRRGPYPSSAELCAPLVPRAVQVLEEIMDDPAAPHLARIHAATKIIERVEGASVQRVAIAQLDERVRMVVDAKMIEDVQRRIEQLVAGDSAPSDFGEPDALVHAGDDDAPGRASSPDHP